MREEATITMRKKHKSRSEGWWWKMMWEKFSVERP